MCVCVCSLMCSIYACNTCTSVMYMLQDFNTEICILFQHHLLPPCDSGYTVIASSLACMWRISAPHILWCAVNLQDKVSERLSEKITCPLTPEVKEPNPSALLLGFEEHNPPRLVVWSHNRAKAHLSYLRSHYDQSSTPTTSFVSAAEEFKRTSTGQTSGTMMEVD